MAKSAEIRAGKKVVGAGIGMAAVGLANRKRPVGGYNPRRPIMPVPQNGKRM